MSKLWLPQTVEKYANRGHVDAALSNLSLAYKNHSYIADLVVPAVPVGKSTDLYWVYGKEGFRAPDSKRGKGAKANAITWGLSTSTYSTEYHSLREFLDQDELDDQDPGIDLRADSVMLETELLKLRREVDAAALLFNATNMTGYTGALAGSTQWSHTDSTPILDVETQRGNIIKRTGQRPNTLILGYEVFAALKSHPKLLDALKYTNLGVVTTQLMAELFEVDRVIVGMAAQDTAAEGQAESMSYVWGKYALLAYINPNPGRKMLSLAYSFQKMNLQTQVYKEEGLDGEWVETGEKYDQKLIAPAAGYLWSAAVA